MNKKQLVILGAGPGGYAAAFMAADQGMDVALIDLEPHPGGACLNWGCIPAKAYLHVAHILGLTREAKAFGLNYAEPHIDLTTMRAWKQNIVTKLSAGLMSLTQARNIEFIQGRASFIDHHNLKITNPGKADARLGFDSAVIATGSRPTTLANLYLESPRLLNSRSALELSSLPKRLLVVGAGYIGLELGSVYSALGSQVTVVEQNTTLLAGIDSDLSAILYQRLKKNFYELRLGVSVQNIEDTGDALLVTLVDDAKKSSQQSFDNVLVAVGRKPNSSGIGLDGTEVKTNARGFIEVEENRQTTVPNIFAIGDVCGEPMLAHKATHEARIAVRALNHKATAFMPQAIPAVMYTNPELAWCGLTEQDALKQQKDVKVVKFPWTASGRAMTLNSTDGLTKLIIDKSSERLLGAAIIGTGAAEMIAEMVVAIEMNALAADLSWCIHPHPSLSETLMEAADVFYHESLHLYHPPGRKK